MRYDLGVMEQEALRSLAAARGAFWRARGVKSRKIARNRSDLDIDTLGAFGEYGASVLIGFPFNWDYQRADDGIDGRWRGKTLQIKSMPRQGQDLKFYDWKHFKADVAVAVYVDGARVTLEGVASQKVFLARREQKDYGAGFGLQPCVSAHLLAPMSLLLEPVTRVPPAPPTGTLYERIVEAYSWSSDGVRCAGCRLYDPNPASTMRDFARSLHYNGCRYLSFGTDEIPLRVAAVEDGS